MIELIINIIWAVIAVGGIFCTLFIIAFWSGQYAVLAER